VLSIHNSDISKTVTCINVNIIVHVYSVGNV
jgi:hypothetical protein